MCPCVLENVRSSANIFFPHASIIALLVDQAVKIFNFYLFLTTIVYKKLSVLPFWLSPQFFLTDHLSDFSLLPSLF